LGIFLNIKMLLIFGRKIFRGAPRFRKNYTLFNKYQIKGVKFQDYLDFCKAAELMKNKAHTTREGASRGRSPPSYLGWRPRFRSNPKNPNRNEEDYKYRNIYINKLIGRARFTVTSHLKDIAIMLDVKDFFRRPSFAKLPKGRRGG
jgi:hypothetical protein